MSQSYPFHTPLQLAAIRALHNILQPSQGFLIPTLFDRKNCEESSRAKPTVKEAN